MEVPSWPWRPKAGLKHQGPQGPIGIFWDIENCPVPQDVNAEDVAQNVCMALRLHNALSGQIIRFSAYGDFNQFPRRLREGCQRTGITLVDVVSGKKDAADKAILVDMFLYAIDNKTPSTIMLISGDVDFAAALHKLCQRGYHILLAVPATTGVSGTLCSAATYVWDWVSLANGEGCVPAKTALNQARTTSQTSPEPTQEPSSEPPSDTSPNSKDNSPLRRRKNPTFQRTPQPPQPETPPQVRPSLSTLDLASLRWLEDNLASPLPPPIKVETEADIEKALVLARLRRLALDPDLRQMVKSSDDNGAASAPLGPSPPLISGDVANAIRNRDMLWRLGSEQQLPPGECFALSAECKGRAAECRDGLLCENGGLGDEERAESELSFASFVQPGDLAGLKKQLVKLVATHGGRLGLVRVPSEYRREFKKPLFLSEYGVPKLTQLIERMGDGLTVVGMGQNKTLVLTGSKYRSALRKYVGPSRSWKEGFETAGGFGGGGREGARRDVMVGHSMVSEMNLLGPQDGDLPWSGARQAEVQAAKKVSMWNGVGSECEVLSPARSDLPALEVRMAKCGEDRVLGACSFTTDLQPEGEPATTEQPAAPPLSSESGTSTSSSCPALSDVMVVLDEPENQSAGATQVARPEIIKSKVEGNPLDQPKCSPLSKRAVTIALPDVAQELTTSSTRVCSDKAEGMREDAVNQEVSGSVAELSVDSICTSSTVAMTGKGKADAVGLVEGFLEKVPDAPLAKVGITEGECTELDAGKQVDSRLDGDGVKDVLRGDALGRSMENASLCVGPSGWGQGMLRWRAAGPGEDCILLRSEGPSGEGCAEVSLNLASWLRKNSSRSANSDERGLEEHALSEGTGDRAPVVLGGTDCGRLHEPVRVEISDQSRFVVVESSSGRDEGDEESRGKSQKGVEDKAFGERIILDARRVRCKTEDSQGTRMDGEGSVTRGEAMTESGGERGSRDVGTATAGLGLFEVRVCESVKAKAESSEARGARVAERKRGFAGDVIGAVPGSEVRVEPGSEVRAEPGGSSGKTADAVPREGGAARVDEKAVAFWQELRRLQTGHLASTSAAAIGEGPEVSEGESEREERDSLLGPKVEETQVFVRFCGELRELLVSHACCIERDALVDAYFMRYSRPLDLNLLGARSIDELVLMTDVANLVADDDGEVYIVAV